MVSFLGGFPSPRSGPGWYSASGQGCCHSVWVCQSSVLTKSTIELLRLMSSLDFDEWKNFPG